MSMLYSSAGGDDGWRPDTAQSHQVEQPQPQPQRSLATAEGRSLPARAMHRMLDHLVERKAVVAKMFAEYDTDGSGTIDADELNAALMDLGLRLSAEEIDAIMSHMDSDGGGDIDLGEFIEHFKQARAERFDGYIPELKQAKNELLRKLRTHAPLQIDGGAGLYKMLVQIERLQALEHLSPDQVAELRAQVVELLKNGMSGGPTESQALQASIRRHAMPAFNQSQKYSSGRWDENRPKPWKVGSHEIKGPRMEAARSRKRLSTAEWRRRSTEVKLGELDAGKHRREPKRPWDTRQARHTFATHSGQTAITMAQPRERNTEWAPNGLLEDDPPRDRSKGAVKQPAQQTAPEVAPEVAAPKATQKSKGKRHSRGSRGTPDWVSQSGGYGTYGGDLRGLGESKSMPQLDPLPPPMDGTGRPPLGYRPSEPVGDPWSSTRFSQGGPNDQEQMGNQLPAMAHDARGSTTTDAEQELLTDTRGFESKRGYVTITDGGAKPAPIPTLLQMAPTAPQASGCLDQHGGLRSQLYPSEIRGTMQSQYRGKFAEGERGPLNEFAHVSQVSGNGLEELPQTPSKNEMEKFLRYGVRPDNWKQATQSASREAGLRWSTGGGSHPSYGGGAHGPVVGTVWLE